MILFTVLMVVLIIALLVGLAVLGVIGTGTILVFGDLIIFILIVVGLFKLIFKKKK